MMKDMITSNKHTKGIKWLGRKLGISIGAKGVEGKLLYFTTNVLSGSGQTHARTEKCDGEETDD